MENEELIKQLDACVDEIKSTLKKRGIEVTHEAIMSFYEVEDYFQHIYGPAGQYVMEKLLKK